MVDASSSPMVRMFMRQRRAKSTIQPTRSMGNIIVTCVIFAPVKLPMSQYVMSASSSVGSAMSFAYDTPAWNRELTITPASTTTIMWFPFARALMRSTRRTVSKAKAKADTETMPAVKPARMATAAPNAAPWLAPRMSGETSGFWNVPWYAAPATDRQHPTMRARRMRGRRTLKKSVACCSVQLGSTGTTQLTSMAMASRGSMG